MRTKTHKQIILTTLVLAFTGCVSTQNVPVTEDTMTDMDGKSLVVAKREKPDFVAMTAGKAMFGLIGAGAMVDAGNKIVQENQVADPAAYIAQALSEDFSDKHGVIVNTDDTVAASGESAAELSQQYGSNDYLLDIKTFDWGFQYFPTDWNSYRVYYKAKLRLIDTRKKKVVAEGFCSRIPDKTDGAPSREALIENNARILKSELQAAADYCVNEFRSKTLQL